MLLVVHRNFPTTVFATHRNLQEDEVVEAYSAADYGILKVSGRVEPRDPIPVEFEVVRHVPTVAA